jgi:hypothetical protein
VILIFDQKLWQEHRKQLTKELLERFNFLKITFQLPNHDISKGICDMNDVIYDIKEIHITFDV